MINNTPNINLFIVGAAKAGTTSLYHYLSQHSEVFFPLVKEPNYYSRAEAHNPDAYKKPREGKFYHNKIIRSKEVYHSLYKGSRNYKVVGDASPSYLWDKSSAENIHNDFPNAKIIIILRNPVERAFSHFLMDLKSGNQKEHDFLKALKNDRDNESKIWGKAHLYEELGMYYNQTKKYIDVFSKNNVKVILYEELIKDTKSVMLELLDFLSLDTSELSKIDFTTQHNPYLKSKNILTNHIIRSKKKLGGVKRYLSPVIASFITDKLLYSSAEKPPIPTSSKNYLKKAYKEDLLKLEKLLNINLSAWKV